MAGGVEQTDRPGMAGWVLASACAGALGGFVLPAPPGACFLSAGLVGLAQGLLLRRGLDWWSWALTTLIIGGGRACVGAHADDARRRPDSIA